MAIKEDRRDKNTITYQTVDKLGNQSDDSSKVSKVIATLQSYDSARYTKLGRNLLRIEELANELTKLKEANVNGVMLDIWWGISEQQPK